MHLLIKLSYQLNLVSCKPKISQIQQRNLTEKHSKLLQGAIIRVPTYRRYAKFMVWYFFVFRQVPRRYAEICYSRTYIFLLAITSKPAKVFKTVKNFSCTCKFHASDIFWDEKSQKVIFALDQKIYRHRPTEKKSLR